jgi:hypothetical protein
LFKELLGKGAIELVPPGQEGQGFYSTFFIVLKKDGGLHSGLWRFAYKFLTQPFLYYFQHPGIGSYLLPFVDKILYMTPYLG